MCVFLALISAANQVLAKYNFAYSETAAPIGTLLIIESIQRSFVKPLGFAS
jgi:hypothetical protein